MGYIIENKKMTSISKKAKIGKGSIIKIGSIIEDNSEIGENCVIGPYAHIHTNSKIGDDCVIGNFVEIKNSTLGNKCKAKHLVYIGDCKCGNNVNFGCGVVIANFNGISKNETIIKDNVFIGCNSNLIAPVSIGNDSFIAAGVSISKDVLDNEFVYSKRNIEHRENKIKR